MAQLTDAVYDEVEALFVFCIFEEIFDPDDADYWAAEAAYFLEILVGMDAVDEFWNLIASGLESSDGLVPTSSQSYPSSSATQYPIYGADSHTGATTSTYVHTTLDQVLEQQFQVPTQASCAFSTSPTSYSISGNGGTSSFSLTTSAGCQWSTVSQAPWLSITSGTSGTSSGTVGFSVASNPVTIPRMSTIQVGNASSIASFTVDEAGVCTYALSPGVVALPPGGGTDTISVNTQGGCVWSAVPNANWLTITAGASGTGPGSFTLAASSNLYDMDLTGTITVMNQTLTVILGDPTGTPGTGSVTIDKSFWPTEQCTWGECTWESGTVSALVGGLTFTVSYGSASDSQASIASALAAQMNYQDSPISATASGSTVAIKSSVNGAATNYPIGTAYTCNTDNGTFRCPGYWATASGLTGGSN